MNYCGEKGIVCDTANENGHCKITACNKHNHFVSGVIKTCGGCDKTDGVCYTSNPPKVKCTVTGNFHFYGDTCDCMSYQIADIPTFPNSQVMYQESNQCEICGDNTEDTYHHLCKRCIKKLFKLLYVNDGIDKFFE